MKYKVPLQTGSFYMSKYHSHLTSTNKILSSYAGQEPFAYYIKKYFAANKKYGSKDRKSISAYCYYYFRVVHLFKDIELDEKIINAVFLCSTEHADFIAFFKPDWALEINNSYLEKCKLLGVDYIDAFPLLNMLSPQIKGKEFALSLAQQPDLFLRIRPLQKDRILAKLEAAEIPYVLESATSIRIKNAATISSILTLNKEVVVQDISSQKVFRYFEENPQTIDKSGLLNVWDCCAASGGKSILIFDVLKGKIKLTVSDIRKSILHNCQQRLQEAKVPIYQHFIADMMQYPVEAIHEKFSFIICDVPCTGSGTWGRTPEQLLYFKKESILEFQRKQISIATNAVKYLSSNGFFVYITCSVFKSENEEVVQNLLLDESIQLIDQKYYLGYTTKADSLFVAIFRKI